MKPVFEVMRRDLRRCWPYTALFVVSLAATVWFDPDYGADPTQWPGLLVLFPPLACWLQVVTLIQGNSPADAAAVWPGWRPVLTAKALFLVAAVAVPVLLSHLGVLTAWSIPIPVNLPALCWKTVWASAFYVLLPAAVACLTLRRWQAALAMIAILPMWYLAHSVWAPQDAFRQALLLKLLITAATALILFQYALRRTGWSWLLLFAAIAITFAAVRLIPPEAAIRFASGFRDQPERDLPMQFTVDAGRTSRAQVAHDRQHVEVRIPVRAILPAGYAVSAKEGDVTLSAPGSPILVTASPEFEGQYRSKWLVFRILQQRFDSLRNQPVQVSARFRFAVRFERELELRTQGFRWVPEVGLCRTQDNWARGTPVWARTGVARRNPSAERQWLEPPAVECLTLLPRAWITAGEDFGATGPIGNPWLIEPSLRTLNLSWSYGGSEHRPRLTLRRPPGDTERQFELRDVRLPKLEEDAMMPDYIPGWVRPTGPGWWSR